MILNNSGSVSVLMMLEMPSSHHKGSNLQADTGPVRFLIGDKMNIETLFEEFERKFEPVLFEVSRIRSSILKKIETDFDLIRKEPNNRSYIKSLQDNLKEFTGIPKIVITANINNFDAAIFPVYVRELPKIARDNPKSITPKTLKNT